MAEEYIVKDMCGSCQFTIDREGTMTISPNKEFNNKTGTLNFKTVSGPEDWPWFQYRDDIKKVIVDKGVTLGAVGDYLFAGFRNCRDFQLENLDVSMTENFEYMFMGCDFLTDISSTAAWDFQKAWRLNGMLCNCPSLEDIAPAANWDVSNAMNFNEMFAGDTSLKDLTPTSGWNMRRAIFMDRMLAGCTGLESLCGTENWNAVNAGSINGICEGCTSLKDISAAGSWKMSSVLEADRSFMGCRSLKDISPVGNWKDARLQNIRSIFEGCTSLEDISPVAKLYTGDIVDMSYAFKGCDSLKDILPVMQWGIKDMDEGWEPGIYFDCTGIFADCPNVPDFTARIDADGRSVVLISKFGEEQAELTAKNIMDKIFGEGTTGTDFIAKTPEGVTFTKEDARNVIKYAAAEMGSRKTLGKDGTIKNIRRHSEYAAAKQKAVSEIRRNPYYSKAAGKTGKEADRSAAVK